MSNKKYSKEFKLDTLSLVTEQGYSQANEINLDIKKIVRSTDNHAIMLVKNT